MQIVTFNVGLLKCGTCCTWKYKVTFPSWKYGQEEELRVLRAWAQYLDFCFRPGFVLYKEGISPVVPKGQ